MKQLGDLFRQERAVDLIKITNGWQVNTQQNSYKCDQIVVACGAQSMHLLKFLRIKIPLAIERGYHLMYRPEEGEKLNRTVSDNKMGLVFRHMNNRHQGHIYSQSSRSKSQARYKTNPQYAR